MTPPRRTPAGGRPTDPATGGRGRTTDGTTDDLAHTADGPGRSTDDLGHNADGYGRATGELGHTADGLSRSTGGLGHTGGDLARTGGGGRRARPTKAELAAAADRTIPDVIADGLDVVFVGINPGLWSAATGWHFARPGNRFWPALHRGGFTPRQLHPGEQDELPRLGLGITNMVARASARADELTAAELVAGAEILADKVRRRRPAWVAVVGVTAYRIGFARPKAGFGPQPERLAGARLWVLPNPSGLNAHFTAETLGAAFGELRAAVTRP